METNSTNAYERTVGRLVADLTPVSRVWPLRRQLAAWCGLAILLVGCMTWLAPRPDLISSLAQPRFAFELGLMALVAVLLAGAALRGAIPGRGMTSGSAVPWAAGVIVVTLLAWSYPMDATLSVGAFLATGIPCAELTLGLALAPMAALLLVLGRGFATMPLLSGVVLGSAAGVTSLLAMRVHCPIDDGLHQLIWHVAMVVPLAAFSAAISSFLVSRRVRY